MTDAWIIKLWLGGILVLLTGLVCWGCADNRAGIHQGDDAQVMAKLNSIFDFTSGVKTKIDNSRNLNDKWSERLAIIGIIIMASAYPVGKIVWLMSHRAIKKAASWPSIVMNGKIDPRHQK